MSYIYVASPYSHPEQKIEEDRYRATEEFCAEWTRRGYILYSPIIHFHNLAKVHELPGTFEFWREHNTTMLRCSRGVWVFLHPGWQESKGVTYEINLAQKLLIPVTYKHPAGWKETENVSNL